MQHPSSAHRAPTADAAPDGSPVRVAITNDYELVLSGLRAMLTTYGERVDLVAAGMGVDEAGDVGADVILVDTFGRGRGHEAALLELIDGSGARVVVYSWSYDASTIEALIARGAAGYLSKGLSAGDLVGALEVIRDGSTVVSTEDLFVVVPDSAEADWPGRSLGLSQREAEVISGITRGLTNEEIASSLFLSINSVKTYIRAAYRKIGVERRAQAVVWGLKHGFVPRPGQDGRSDRRGGQDAGRSS